MKEKIIDYRRFGTTLLMFSVFLFLGSILPKEGMTVEIKAGLTICTVIGLTLSTLFFYKSHMFEKQLNEME